MSNVYLLQKELEKIGLSHHESQVYLALLKNGESSASGLAKISQAPRTTIRSVLQNLCQKGIASKVYKGNTQFYFCLPTDSLQRSVQQSIEEKKRSLDTLKAIDPLLNSLRGSSTNMPLVQYFEGELGIIESFNHSLITQPTEILFITSYDFFQTERIKEYDVHEYLPERIRRNIPMRVLCEKNESTMYWKKRSKEELRQHRFVANGTLLPGNFFIYDKYVLYFSANNGEYIATLTKSAIMASTLKAVFDALWSASAE